MSSKHPTAESAPGIDIPAIVESLASTESKRNSAPWSAWLRVLLFGITAILFLIVGIIGVRSGWLLLTSFEFAVFFLVVIVHEGGHFIAARWAGYTNLKMFFLPLVGAAVHGDSDHVPSWKQGCVLLAGPVPGILVALGTALVYSKTRSEPLKVLAVMFAAVNLVNLVPISILDGGKLLYSTVFCRVWWAQTVFYGMSIVALSIVAWILDDWIMSLTCLVLAIFACGPLILSTFAPRIADRLRSGDLGPTPGKASELSAEQLMLIAVAIRQALGNDEDVAYWVPDVLAALKNRPMDAQATLAFCGIHVFACVAAVWALLLCS